jgi:hypothetical protein
MSFKPASSGVPTHAGPAPDALGTSRGALINRHEIGAVTAAHSDARHAGSRAEPAV